MAFFFFFFLTKKTENIRDVAEVLCAISKTKLESTLWTGFGEISKEMLTVQQQ